MNTEYRTKLFDHWPTYLEDFSGEVGQKISWKRLPSLIWTKMLKSLILPLGLEMFPTSS